MATTTYLRLFPATTQFELKNGALNVGGRLFVHYEGTDDLAEIRDENGTVLQQPAILDNDGRALGLFVDSKKVYWLDVQDASGATQFTVRKMTPSGGGAGSSLGPGTVITSNDGSIGVTETPYGYDLSVEGVQPAILKAGADPLSQDGQFVFDVHQQEGDRLYIDEQGRIRMMGGWYHYDVTVELSWDMDPRNAEYPVSLYTTLSRSVIDFDASFQHAETIQFSGDVHCVEDGAQMVFGVSGMPTGMVATVIDAGMHAITNKDIGGGEYQAGEGIEIDNAKYISVDLDVVQHKLTAGSNIEIVGNTINATAAPQQQADWAVTDTSSPQYILNKPSIPAAAKNGALNITVGSANAQTFTADQADNAPVNVNIPLASKTTEGGTTTYAEGLMSADQNRKLDEIEAGAEANTIEGVSVNGADLTPDPSTKVVDIPAAGYSTSGATTTYTDGAMRGEDKEKLDNLKNFSKIVLSDGASTPTLQEVVPTDDDDTLTLVAGNGVTMTKDPDSNKVTVSSSAQPMTISEGPGITVTPTTDPTTHVTDFEIGITGIDALGSLSGAGVVVNPAPVSASVAHAKVDLIPASAIPSFNIPNDRIKLIEDANDGHVYLCALKTISDPDPSQAVYGVDTFSVSVNVRTDHNPVRSGVFGETCIQVSRIMDGTNIILGQSMATFPMERGAATDNLTLTIRNTSGLEYTDPETGLVYYRYLLEYIGDGITDPTAESLSIHTYLSAIEETVGISEYNSSQSSYTEGAGISINPNDNSISVNTGPGLEVSSLTNKVGVKVKPGGGVAIDPTDGISVILEGSAQEAVEIAKATQETIDERIITNMSFSEIHDSFNYGSDFNVSGNSQFYATLFTPVMTQEVKAGAKIGIYMRQPGSQGEFALAIYEFDFSNPTQINLVCHTDFQWCGNYAEATSGNNVSAFREIPITYIDPDRNKMKSENLYYTAIITKMDNNNAKCNMQGIFGTTGYSSPLNGIPRLTLAVDNFASTAAQAYSNLNNTGLHQYYGTLDSSIGSELANTRRLFMSIRNIHQSA